MKRTGFHLERGNPFFFWKDKSPSFPRDDVIKLMTWGWMPRSFVLSLLEHEWRADSCFDRMGVKGEKLDSEKYVY